MTKSFRVALRDQFGALSTIGVEAGSLGEALLKAAQAHPTWRAVRAVAIDQTDDDGPLDLGSVERMPRAF
jgi:hypothetical protein